MNSLTDNLGPIVLVLAGLCLVLMLVLQSMQIGRLRQRLDSLTRGSDGESLEAVFDAHLETVHQVGRDLDELTARTAVLESSARHHFARLGLVRFNPFPDTGGNQSFALALLDEAEDGFVVSSLHSRTGTRIYAKAIVGGKADTSLSTEENEAMGLARTRKTVRPAQAAPRGPAGRAAAAAADSSAARSAPAAPPKTVPVPPTRAQAPVKGLAAAKSAAPAKAPAAVRDAPAGPASDLKSAGGNEKADRTQVAKGQSKGNEATIEDQDSAVDSERIGRKPGRPVAAEAIPGQRTDTPGS